MAKFGKKIALVLLVTFALCESSYADCEEGASGSGSIFPEKKKGPQQTVKVDYGSDVQTPILYTATDYSGPYDPFDPTGAAAALHRTMKINHQKNLDTVKSYIPPELGKYIKKEAVKLAVSEGQRFAFANPRETAEIVDIYNKAKKLYENAQAKIKKLEKEEAKKAAEAQGKN